MRNSGPRLRAVLLASLVIAVVMAPFGVAATGDVLRAGKRNSSNTETKIVANTPGTNANTGGYATRQSNISSSGGGAIYGCRSALPTSGGPAQEPCLRANNLNTGKAFEFAAHGTLAGTIQTGTAGDGAKPFTTNATGVATGLNADRVDSKSADDIVKDAVDRSKTRWALIDNKGAIVEQSGGFKVIDAGTAGFVYVDAGSSLEGHALTATVAAPDAVGSDVAVSRCGTPAFDCVPAAAKNANSFVVAATDKSGAAATQRTYVTVTP
jgi:hypothetical protein